MIAFVLSGGGNRGAIEAGALKALLQRGIKPDILVGTSAGALNATAFALNPTLEGATQLAENWKRVKRDDIFPGNVLSFAWRLLTGADSLSPNANLRRYIESQLPPGVRTFGDIQNVRLYTTTSNINTSEIFLFGDDPTALLVEAVMSSAAVPLFLPPIAYGGWQFVDGAVCADVPISIAVEKGATEIYAIYVGTGALPQRSIRGLVNIGQRAIAVTVYQQLLEDLQDVSQLPGVQLHFVPIQSYPEIGDFDHAGMFITEGYDVMMRYLDGGGTRPSGIQALALSSPPPPGAVKWNKRKKKP